MMLRSHNRYREPVSAGLLRAIIWIAAFELGGLLFALLLRWGRL